MPHPKRYSTKVVASIKMLPNIRGGDRVGEASVQDRYRTSCRKDKSRILDEFIATIDSDRAVFGNCADSLAIPGIATPA